jgi:hypothetical protein
VLKQKSKKSDALSHRITLLNIMLVEVVRMNYLNTLYEEDAYFLEAWKACKETCSLDKTPYLDYHIEQGNFLKNQQLCIPISSIQLNIIKELHSGGLGGHFGMDKTTTLVKERYFWPIFNKDV